MRSKAPGAQAFGWSARAAPAETRPLDWQRLREEAEELAARHRFVTARVKRSTPSMLEGAHQQRRAGAGEDFWQFRPYQAGEPAQNVDWRQSARSQRMLVREREYQSTRTFWLSLDLSPSMRFASNRDLPSKLERGALLLLTLAQVVQGLGERVALLEGLAPPGRGRAGMDRLCFDLQQLAKGHDEGQAEKRRADRMPGRFGRVVLIGDHLDAPEDLAARLRPLSQAAVHPTGICVLDPAEEDLPYQGRTRFSGAEGEEPMLIDRAEGSRDSFARELAAHRLAVRDVYTRLGGHLINHRTDKPASAGLLDALPALELGGVA